MSSHAALLARRVKAILECPSNRFDELVRVAELDPATDLRFGDWRDLDFSGSDLREFNFTGADLSGARLDGAQIAGAKFDGATFRRSTLSNAADFDASDVAQSDGRLAQASNAEVAVALYAIAEQSVRRFPGPGGAAEREKVSDGNLAMLVEAVAARGDRNAFGQLHDHFAPRIHSFLMRSGVDPSVAEDITQDVLTKLWQHAGQFDRRKSSVTTWLFCIARNARIDHFRRRRGEPTIGEEALLVPDNGEAADEALHNAQLEARVRAAMANLPAEQLAIIRLAFFDGLSHSEIAAWTGLRMGTVKGRIRLALARLRRDL